MNTLVGEHSRVKSVSKLRVVSFPWHGRSIRLRLYGVECKCMHAMVATIAVTGVVVGQPMWLGTHLAGYAAWNAFNGLLV